MAAPNPPFADSWPWQWVLGDVGPATECPAKL